MQSICGVLLTSQAIVLTDAVVNYLIIPISSPDFEKSILIEVGWRPVHLLKNLLSK